MGLKLRTSKAQEFVFSYAILLCERNFLAFSIFICKLHNKFSIRFFRIRSLKLNVFSWRVRRSFYCDWEGGGWFACVGKGKNRKVSRREKCYCLTEVNGKLSLNKLFRAIEKKLGEGEAKVAFEQENNYICNSGNSIVESRKQKFFHFLTDLGKIIYPSNSRFK